MHIVFVSVSLFSINNNLLKLAQESRNLYTRKTENVFGIQSQEIKSHNTKKWLMRAEDISSFYTKLSFSPIFLFLCTSSWSCFSLHNSENCSLSDSLTVKICLLSIAA